MSEPATYKENTVTYVDADLYAEFNDPARAPQILPGLAAAAAKKLELTNAK